MVRSGRKAVSSAGTRVSLLDPSVDHKVRMAGWVTVCADKNNGGIVYVGDATTQNASGSGGYIGIPLTAGEFVNIREMGGPSYLDLALIYIDADTSTDAVTFNYGQR
jgi:hypothetical protein